MRVHLIKERSIDTFCTGHQDRSVSFGIWLTKIKFAEWERPSDIKHTFKTADILGKGSSRVVFNIGGDNYRMICKYYFGLKKVSLFICWIGTHTEYSGICNKGIQNTIKVY